MLNNISTLTSTLLNVTQIVLLITTKSYFLYTVVMPFFTVLNNLLISVEVKKRFPQYICRGEISAEMKGDMRKKVSGLMLQRVCAATRNTMDNIFVSAFLGLSITAMYSNYYYIKHAVTILMGIIITSMLGGLAIVFRWNRRKLILQICAVLILCICGSAVGLQRYFCVCISHL